MYPPLIFFAEDDYRGLDAELARQLARELRMRLDIIELPWEELLPALRNDRIDIVMSGMSITRKRLNLVAFSDPYLRVDKLALVRKDDLEQYDTLAAIMLTPGKVGVKKDTTTDDLVRERFHYADRVPFASLEDAAQDLIDKEIDMVVGDSPSILWYAATKEWYGLVPIPRRLDVEFLGWAVRHDDEALLEEVNHFLAEWQANGKLDNAITRWMPPVE